MADITDEPRGDRAGTSTDRALVPVDGAAELLAQVVEAAADGSRLPDAADVLRATASSLDLRDAAARSAADGRGVVLARHPSGAALAAKWFPPGVPTPIHENNGWGLALVVSGSDRYERWALRDDGTVALVEERRLSAGDCAWWGRPPHDIHRQEGLGAGALELIVVGAEPTAPLAEYRPAAGLEPGRTGRA
jgi:hypothetical protein